MNQAAHGVLSFLLVYSQPAHYNIYAFASFPDCSFENRIFVDGEAFPNPVSVCEECKCVSGQVDCHHAQCPNPHCNAPRPGTCCQNNCNGEET